MTRTHDKPTMKLGAQVLHEPLEDELQFIAQMGVEYVILRVRNENSWQHYTQLRKRVEKAGLTLYGILNYNVHNQDAIVLNLPNRDQKIAEYKEHLRNLGKASIPYTTYAHMANGIWRTEPEKTRGGALGKAFDLSKASEGYSDTVSFRMPLSHGRRFSTEELWDNFAYFVKEVTPVAEEAGVKVGIHPDDPPQPELAGVPRIFSSFGGFKRALEMANSPNIGMCLCVGCWLEGGALMGTDVLETIRLFGSEGKIFKVHLRNVNAPSPHFVETFVDDGYGDLSAVVKTLRDVGFDGLIIPDENHIPLMANDKRAGTAFTIGYIKALIEQGNTAVKES
jgi:mannonate dehydratase